MLDFGAASSVVVAMSGGIDSYVCAYDALGQGLRVTLFHSRCGKPTSPNELSASKQFAIKHNVYLEVGEFAALSEIQIGSLPLEAIAGEWDAIREFGAELRITGFPVVMTAIMYFAQISERDGVIFGLTSEQVEERNVPEGALALESQAKHFNPHSDSVKIILPLLGMRKSDVIRRGSELGVPFQDTWSCASMCPGLHRHCGECLQCRNRKAAFDVAKVRDPTNYLA